MAQNDTLLAHLQKGNSITPLKARHVYGIERLASRIHDLVRMGHPVVKTMRQDETGGRYAEYSLPKKPVPQAVTRFGRGAAI